MATPDKAFVNSFWGLQDVGFAAVQQRIKTSQSTLSELLFFYKKRIAIEREYNKRLEKISANCKYGNGETGSLKVALDKLHIESERMVEQHNKFVRSVSLHNYEKLHNFSQIYAKNVAKIENHMQKVLARKHDLKQNLCSTKEKYRTACAREKTFRLQCQTTWGKELEVYTAKFNKVQLSLSSLALNYQMAVDKYREIHEIWVRDWSIALLSIYLLEVERIQICKLTCFSFCNNVASLCVDWDQSVDIARSSFANVAAPKDASEYVITYGTGSEIPGPPGYVDFSNGCDDSDETAYTTANFKDPDYTQILSRTFSNHAAASLPIQKKTPTSSPPRNNLHQEPRTPSPQKSLPPIKTPLDHSSGKIKYAAKLDAKPESHTNLLKQPSQYSNVTGDSNDIFDTKTHNASTHLSVYSHPSSVSNDTKRSWASPKRKLIQEMQQEINRRLQDMSYVLAKSPDKPTQSQKDVPIIKDFSIDFIAKALEDLNAGGNGDVNKFRRSVRLAALQTSPVCHTLDFVDDSNEQATRKDSIVFQAPVSNLRKSTVSYGAGGHKSQQDDSPTKQHRRSLLQSPTKSFKNLHSFVEGITPVTKAKYVTKAVAKYTYEARENGELSFRKGWRMYIIHKQEDNWYVCELAENCGSKRGSVGLVPYNYVFEGVDVF